MAAVIQDRRATMIQDSGFMIQDSGFFAVTPADLYELRHSEFYCEDSIMKILILTSNYSGPLRDYS